MNQTASKSATDPKSSATPATKIGLIGSGIWATALANILHETGQEFNWYFRFRSQIRAFKKQGHNPNYLTSVSFDTSKIHFYSDLTELVEESDTLLLCTPSPYLKGVLQKVDPEKYKGKVFLNAVKGIIPDSYQLVSDFLSSEFGIPMSQIAVISGPTHAEEVAIDRTSYLTIGCEDEETALRLAPLFHAPYVHTVISTDVRGIEYSSVLKNIYAIASGITQGMKLGDNFMAVLICNATGEIKRFIRTATESRPQVYDSAYLGDLLVTAYSRYSRNRTFGNFLGKGYGVYEAQLEMEMIAEGFYGAKCIHEVNKRYGVEIPIADAVYDILYEHVKPEQAFKNLKPLLK